MLDTIDMWKYKIYSPKKSLTLLSELEKKWAILYWIDGIFCLPDNKFQPSMENSIDYSSRNAKFNIFNSSNLKIYKLAKDFIQHNTLPNLYFEIVTNEK